MKLSLAITAGLPVLLLAAALPATAQLARGTPDAAELARRAEWLKQHAAPIRTSDPADSDFRDLEPIGNAIGNATVVLLGSSRTGTAKSS